jgi:hypothetical protein
MRPPAELPTRPPKRALGLVPETAPVAWQESSDPSLKPTNPPANLPAVTVPVAQLDSNFPVFHPTNPPEAMPLSPESMLLEKLVRIVPEFVPTNPPTWPVAVSPVLKPLELQTRMDPPRFVAASAPTLWEPVMEAPTRPRLSTTAPLSTTPNRPASLPGRWIES